MHLSLLIGVSHWLFHTRSQQVLSEHPKFIMRSCVNSKSIDGYLVEIVCRSNVGKIMCRSQNRVWIAQRIKFGRVDRFENSHRVLL